VEEEGEEEVAAAETTDEEEDEDATQDQAVSLSPGRDTWQVPAELRRALESLEIQRSGKDGDKVWARRGQTRVLTTLRPDLQAAAQNLLRDYDVPAGAIVVMEPGTGRVLAMAGHTASRKHGPELAAIPLAPAASIFKVVTGAALLEKGVSPSHETCFSGGLRRVRAKDLKANPARDHRCVSFASAMAKSSNIPFARMTQDNLTGDDLTRWAGRLWFNQPLPLGGLPSTARIPAEGGLEFAATGAGFGDVRMSTLHGAMLAAAVGNGGTMRVPTLWADARPPAGTRVLDGRQARALQGMLERTVTEGTARKYFRERRRSSSVMAAAGKTGSLNEQAPFRDYSWFVGYAPADKPTVAVATFIMNKTTWRVRAPYVAKEILKTALVKGHNPYRPNLDVARR
jgi:cell division protein FtsI/penicillin-binding protein 2